MWQRQQQCHRRKFYAKKIAPAFVEISNINLFPEFAFLDSADGWLCACVGLRLQCTEYYNTFLHYFTRLFAVTFATKIETVYFSPSPHM